jgi:hypothetical protein
VSTTEMGAPRPSTRRLIFARSLPLSVGLLPVLWPPKGAAECFESHRLPSPADPAALPCVVLSHPLHQLPEETHAPPTLKTFMDHAGGDPKPIAMEGLPLASRPKHVPDGIDDGSVGSSRSAALPALCLLFGQALLEFPPLWSRKTEVVRIARCGSLSHKAHLLRER